MTTSEALAPSGNLTAVEIRAQVNLIQEVMLAVMKDGTHFGTIPGTNKPTLYKAGSEKILSTFRIACDPEVEDLSIPGEEARFRVRAKGMSQVHGTFLGAGVGECSSSEEKYRWRAAVCDQEWDETPEDRRRNVWKKGGDKGPYRIKQVRTEPADLANTVLKMAKKRAQIDMTLTVTAASDVFAQDIEDLPEELRGTADDAPATRTMQAPQRRNAGATVVYDGPLPDGIVRLTKVESKGFTKKNGEAGKKFTIHDSVGRQFGTFNETDADLARKYIGSKTPLGVRFVETEKFGNDLKGFDVWTPPPTPSASDLATGAPTTSETAAAANTETRDPGMEG